MNHGRVNKSVRDDRGSVAVLMCFIVLISGTLVSFLVDAGARIDAGNRAETYASEAARAASSAIGPIPAAGGSGGAGAGAAAARSYLDAVGATGTVTVTGPATVEVIVTVSETSPILGITVRQTRQHTAQLQVGVNSGEPVS